MTTTERRRRQKPARQPVAKPEVQQRSTSKVRHAEAYARAVEPFLHGTVSARRINQFLLSHLKKVKWGTRGADNRWVYAYGGLHGVIAARVDALGRIGYAFYEMNNPHASFKRRRDRFPFAKLGWLTAPEVYAQVLGGVQGRVEPQELGEWAHRLRLAAGLIRTYTFAPLPDPDSAEGDIAWRKMMTVLGMKRRPRKVERRAYALYMKVLVPAWISSAQHSRTGLPGHLARSDTYLAQALQALPGFECSVTRQQVTRAMEMLDAGGYVVATRTVGETFAAGKVARAGYYRYLPGTGVPPAAPTRHQGIDATEALRAQRRYERSGLVGPALTTPHRRAR